MLFSQSLQLSWGLGYWHRPLGVVLLCPGAPDEFNNIYATVL